MFRWRLWVVLGVMMTAPVRPRMVEMVQMLVEEPIHRVQQDSLSGIQKIRIFVERDGGRSVSSSVLPLSIESAAYSQNDEHYEHSRETPSKRQVHTTKTTPKPQTRTTPKPNLDNIMRTTLKTEVSSANSRPNPLGRNETHHIIDSKPSAKVEPKPNQFGIGSTLVLTVGDAGEPTYVDQTQPQKVAKPLRYDSERDRPVPQQSTLSNPRPYDEQPEEPYVNIRKPQRNEPEEIYAKPQRNEQEQPYVKPQRNDPEESYVKPQRNEPSQHYDSYSNPSEDPKPYKQVNNDRYETRPVNSSPYDEPVRQVYSETVEDTRNQPRRPAYDERPLQPEPSRERRPILVDERPQQSSKTRPLEDSEYAGFPNSFQQSPPLSRPLQNDPQRGFPPSPCPGVFRYEGGEPRGDSWEGEIYLTTDEVLTGIWINITLDRPARLLSNHLAEVETSDNQIFSILSRKRLLPGAPENVRFLVRFDPARPIPLVQFINLNGRRICPVRPQGLQYVPTTSSPVYEYPGDLLTKPPRRPYEEQTTRRPVYEPHRETTRRPIDSYEEQIRPSTIRPIRQPDRRPQSTESYEPEPTRRPTRPPLHRPDPNPTIYEETQGNRLPQVTYKPTQSATTTTPATYENIPCGKPSVQPRPLVTHGHMTARGQWPWHAAIYKNVGIDLSYICGGSLISNRHVVTAAHCVTKTYDVKPVDPSVLVVYLGKYHLRLWSEGGVQNKQVSEVKVHPSYNSSDFRADLAVLVLSSRVEFTDFIRPVCLWDRRRTDISEVENREGTVIGWGFDEESRLTEELMQAKMPVIKHDVCLWSYPEFFPQFTSNYTYCAGFRNGTSVCNGDSGGGMVFPVRTQGEDRWYLRGLVSISVTEKERKVCDTKHYVVFTDIAKFLDWLGNFV